MSQEANHHAYIRNRTRNQIIFDLTDSMILSKDKTLILWFTGMFVVLATTMGRQLIHNA